MKICSVCKKLKDIEDFSFRSKKDNIRRADCKECYRKKKNQYYQDNKKKELKRLKQVKKQRQKKMDLVIGSHLKSGCIDCGNLDRDLLTFDHISNKFKSISRLRSDNAGIPTVLSEIKKCEIRCYNCHVLKTKQRNNSTLKEKITRYSNLEYLRTLSPARSRHHKTKLENFINILKYLSDKNCINCGASNNDILSFHHINKNTKHYDISFMVKAPFSWNLIFKEITKCTILCHNCHMKLHRRN